MLKVNSDYFADTSGMLCDSIIMFYEKARLAQEINSKVETLSWLSVVRDAEYALVCCDNLLLIENFISEKNKEHEKLENTPPDHNTNSKWYSMINKTELQLRLANINYLNRNSGWAQNEFKRALAKFRKALAHAEDIQIKQITR